MTLIHKRKNIISNNPIITTMISRIMKTTTSHLLQRPVIIYQGQEIWFIRSKDNKGILRRARRSVDTVADANIDQYHLIKLSLI